MSRETDWDEPQPIDVEEAPTAQAVASLTAIARQLMELADYVDELARTPIEGQSILHWEELDVTDA